MALREIWVSVELAAEIIQQDYVLGADGPIRCVEGVPAGTRIVGCYFDALRQCLVIQIDHESYQGASATPVTPIYAKEFEANHAT